MKLKNIDIYLARLLSAFCLFVILAEANLWLDTLNNTILVLGYRLFIIGAPLMFFLFKHRLTFFALILSEIGLLAWLLHYQLLGTMCFAVGMAISGFMLKYYSSFSTKGASGNKIALNLGSIISGLLVLVSQNKQLILVYCGAALIVAAVSFIKYFRREKLNNLKARQSHFNLSVLFTKAGAAWAMVGFVIGVKLIAIISILPQFIMQAHKGKLLGWYGSILIINSIFIVFLQIPIMNRVKHLSRIMAITPLLIAMLIIILSPYMKLATFQGALIWTLLLSFVECTISLLDKLAQDDGLLLIKEAAVGVGSAATVFCVRFFDPFQGAELIGVLSLIMIMVSILLLRKPSNVLSLAVLETS